MIKTALKQLSTTKVDDEYEFLLGVGFDSLSVYDRERNRIETIVHGSNDKYGLLCSAPDEDAFLEAITLIKDMIRDGINPKKVIEG